MDFNVGDYVTSTICIRISGRIKKFINDDTFILQTNDKEIVCNINYYNKQ